MVKRRNVLHACALLLVCSLVWSLAAPAARAQFDSPFNGIVKYGTVANHDLTLPTQVIQTSDRLIIEWDEFNLGPNKSFEFVQPHADAIVLNKVVTNTSSTLFGHLKANGTVILINPTDIYFGGRVEVGSLIASTLDIDYNQFINGTLPFALRGRSGKVSNGGRLQAAPGGAIALIGSHVLNLASGVIEAEGGSAVLAAGTGFAVNFDQDGRLYVIPIARSQQQGTAELWTIPSSEVRADGGLIQMYAVANEALLNMKGTASAKSMGEAGGRILLYTEGGDVMGDTETWIQEGAWIEGDHVDIFGSHGVNAFDGATIIGQEIALRTWPGLNREVSVDDSTTVILVGEDNPTLRISGDLITFDGRVELQAMEPRFVNVQFDGAAINLGDGAAVELFGAVPSRWPSRFRHLEPSPKPWAVAALLRGGRSRFGAFGEHFGRAGVGRPTR